MPPFGFRWIDSRRSRSIALAVLVTSALAPVAGANLCGQSAAGERYFWAAVAGDSPRNNNCFGGSGFRCYQADDAEPSFRLKNPSCDPTVGPCTVELRVPIEFPGVEQMVAEDGLFGSPTPFVYWFAAEAAPACPGTTADCGQEMICGVAGTTAGKINSDLIETWVERNGVTCANAAQQAGTYSLRVMVCRTACRVDTIVNGLTFDGPKLAEAIGCPPPPPPWSCGEPNSCAPCKAGASAGGGGAAAGGSGSGGPFGPGAELRYLAGGPGLDASPGSSAWRVALGRFWSHDYAERIVVDPDDSHVWLITRWATFREFSGLAGGVYTMVTPSDEFRTLARTFGGWTLTDLDGTVTEFDATGLWLSTTDRNGNAKIATYTSGALTSVAFPDGRREDFTYQPGGKLATIIEVGTDGLATRTWEYTWSGDDLTRVERPDGTAWVMTYDVDGYMTLLELEGSDGTSRRVERGWEYDGQGNAIRTWSGATAFAHQDAADKWELVFDDPLAPTVTTVTDPLGQQIVYTIGRDTVSDKPRVESIVGGCPGCGLESDTTFLYGSSNPLLPTEQTDAEGNVTAFTYTAFGQVESRTEAVGTSLARTTSWTYDSAYPVLVTAVEQPSTAGSPNVRRMVIGRNAAGDATSRTIEGIETGSPFSLSTATAYNSAGQPLTVDPPGFGAADATTFTYDGSLGGLVLTSRSDPLVGTTSFDHDAFNRRTSEIDPNGVEVTRQYDPLNRVVQVAQKGAQPSEDLVTVHAYTVFGDLAMTTLPEGNVIEYGYDGMGRLVRVERRSAAGTERERTLYLLDGAGNRISEEHQSWDGVAWTVESLTDYEYWSRCHLGRVLHADGTVTRYDYDCNGNLDRVWDANHPFVDEISTPPTQRSVYDALDRLVEVRQPWSGGGEAVTSYGYDVQDHLTAVTDAEGNTTTYAYSDRDLLTQEVSPVSGTTTHAYNEHGELVTTTDARAITTTRTVDEADRVTFVDYPGADIDVTYTYGTNPALFELGRLTGITRDGATVAYSYDRFGRMTQDGALTYGYDRNGNRTAVGYPGGVGAAYTFDFADREATLAVTSPVGTTPVVTGAAYLPSGPLTSFALGNGTSETLSFTTRYFPASIALDAARDRSYTYTTDSVGNVTSITEAVECLGDVVLENRSVTGSEVHQSCAEVVAGPALTVESAASLTLRGATAVVLRNGFSVAAGATFSAGTDPDLDGGTWTFDYQDVDYFLTSATGPWGALAWSYDKIGNRLSETRDGWTDTYLYTLNGTGGRTPLLSEIQMGVGGSRTFAYGPAGHLTQMNAGGNVVNLTSDAAGRLAEAERLGNTTAFTYDGRSYLTEVGEDTGPLGASRPTYSSEGLVHSLTQRVTTGDPGKTHRVFHLAGRPVAQLSTDGTLETWRYFTTDHLGTPLVATDPTGAELWHGPFEPFGRDRWAGSNLAASEEDLFLRLPGQWDDEVWFEATRGVELFYNLHRWYQSGTGRYARPDPLGLRQTLNLYAYVAANPVRWTDPNGLAIYVCSRRAFVGAATPYGVGNHSYIWDDRDGVAPGRRYCGVWSEADESDRGLGTDACNYVPGSDGREDEIMNCCQKVKADPGGIYFPPFNDCQTGTEDALECAGVPNPGVPGGRTGPPRDQCTMPLAPDEPNEPFNPGRPGYRQSPL